MKLHLPLALFFILVTASAWGAATPGAMSPTLRGAADPLEPARRALRTLQFGRALELLKTAAGGGNRDAQYLLALMYLNGVGTPADPTAARPLLQAAAERGQGAAAYVLASELAHDPTVSAATARHWLEQSAQLGYGRAIEVLKSGGVLLPRQNLAESDPALLPAWIMACARSNNAAELAHLGASARAKGGQPE